MLVSIFNSPKVREEFDITFAYRYSQEYEAGLRKRLKQKIKEEPVDFLTFGSLLADINKLRSKTSKNLLRFFVIGSFLQYWLWLYNALRIFPIIRKVKPDIIYINNGGYPGAYSCLAAVLAAKLAGVNKIVFMVNNIIVPYDRYSRYVDKPIDSFVKSQVSVFLTCSKFAGDKLRELWGLPETRVINIPNTVEPTVLSESPEAVRQRLGLSGGQIILGNVGLLEPRKGQKYLIEALAIVKKRFADFNKIKLIIVGTGLEEEELKKLSAAAGLESNIIFLPRDLNILALINIFDVFILSSIGSEDFPNVIVESMYLGKPVIGTRVAGIPEQVADGVNGFVVDPGEATALAKAILALLEDKQKMMAMGKESQARFKDLFSYDIFVDRVINFFRNTIGGKP